MSVQLTKTQQTNAVGPIMAGLLLNSVALAVDTSFWRTVLRVVGVLLCLAGVYLMGKYMREQKSE